MQRRRLMCAFMLGILPAACGRGGSSDSSAGGPTIGVTIQNREAQFYQQMELGMKTTASKYGYAVEVVDANRDNAKQQSQVEDFISRKVAAIVITPYDSQSIGSAIVEANQAHIPVFTADIANTSKRGVVVSHIASDNIQGGAQAALLICAALGNAGGDVAILDEPEVTSVQDRVRGFKAQLAKSCPAARVVADIDGGGERAKSSAATEDVLQSHPHLAAIFGINDDAALGASKAVSAAQAGGKVAIVGYDAVPEARSAIAKGLMTGDAVQNPEQIGSSTIDAVHAYLSGQKPKAHIAIAVGSFTRADALKSATP